MQYTIVYFELYCLLTIGTFLLLRDEFEANVPNGFAAFIYFVILGLVLVCSPSTFWLALLDNIRLGKYGRCYPYAVPVCWRTPPSVTELTDMLSQLKPNLTIFGPKPAFIYRGDNLWFTRKNDALLFKMWL